MLYSIIPPVLVLASLAGIIIFLMKKAPALASLKDDKRLSPEEKKDRELAARYDALKKENKKSIGERGAGMLKSVVSFFGSSLNFGNSMFHKINDNAKAKLETERIAKNRQAQKDFFQRKLDNQIQITDEEQYDPEMILSDPVIAENKQQESRPEKKDLFEKILIDRIASNPKDIEAYERLGVYYLEIENWEYAKECFKQVIKLNPRNINAQNKMRKLEKILSKR